MPRTGKALTGLLVTLGIPVPVAAAAVWQDFVGRQPVLSAVLLVAYEGMLVLVGLVARAASGPVDRRLTQLGDAVDLALGRRVSRYTRRYREHVRIMHRFADSTDLPLAGVHTPELDKIFVDVSLTPRPPHQVSGGVLADAPVDVTARHSVHEFLDHEEPSVLVVIGAPGSGKTTLLSHLARHVADPQARRRRRRIPILLTLRDHSPGIADNPRRTLPGLVRTSIPPLAVAEPTGWWESQLYEGNCLILLDGLDEVARTEDRRAVTDWIERQINTYPKNDFLITSRPYGYRTARIRQATALQVRPYTNDQVRRFLHGWYLATERHATGETGTEIEAMARDRADDLLDRLAAAPELYELAVNPLLLTMMALVHRYRSALPAGRADLYGEICHVMVWRRQEAKLLPSDLPGSARLRVLAQLAFTMMDGRIRDLPREQVLETIEPSLRRISTAAAAESFLDDAERTGLLIEREHRMYAFAHHTIGEYLAALHIRENSLIDVLVDSVGDPWWQETTLLYVSDSNADSIVSACLSRGTVAALLLAYDCEQIASTLAPELRDRLRQVREDAFSSDADGPAHAAPGNPH